jgi:hypothetical protein
MDEFKISKNMVSKILNRLFKLGVYGKFEVYKRPEIHTKY